jgi:putative CocE/NonD family hydrolase
MVPMSDGVRLATDVWLPPGPGPHPALFIRTPYDRKRVPPLHVAAGYALVVQDCRGKFASEGVFTPLVDEARDGQDGIAWIADQRWCNGRIGMLGASYLGFVQVPAAAGGHEALRCLIPQVCSSSFFRHWARYDGCPALANAIDWNLRSGCTRTPPETLPTPLSELYGSATLDELLDRTGLESPTLRQWMTHDREDAYWDSIDQAPMHSKVRVPAYHMGGWFDHHLPGQFATHQRMRDGAATAEARAGQRLMIGPWGHGAYAYGDTPPHYSGAQTRRYGDWAFGDSASVPIRTFEKRFLDYHLRDRDDGFGEEPPVRIFLMGANRWVDLPDWPPPQAEVQSWYLHSNGHADTASGPGALDTATPGVEEPPDRYRYDPRDPTPTLGGPAYQGIDARGPLDQRALFDRDDFVYYRSQRLPEPLALAGYVDLDLWLTSSAVDTDVIAKLCVIEPSGAVTCITYGSLRCKYRHSFRTPEPLEPGAPTRLHVELGHTACVLPTGARIALLISSSCFPRIVPHSNTLDPPFAGGDVVVADQEILHCHAYPSHLRLPVIPA